MKSCPFCGSDQLENLDAAVTGWDSVHCIDCGARGPCRIAALALRNPQPDGVADGIEAWDVRAVEVSS